MRLWGVAEPGSSCGPPTTAELSLAATRKIPGRWRIRSGPDGVEGLPRLELLHLLGQ